MIGLITTLVISLIILVIIGITLSYVHTTMILDDMLSSRDLEYNYMRDEQEIKQISVLGQSNTVPASAGPVSAGPVSAVPASVVPASADTADGDIFSVTSDGKLVVDENNIIEGFATAIMRYSSPLDTSNGEKCSVFPDTCQYISTDMLILNVDNEFFSSYKSPVKDGGESLVTQCLKEFESTGSTSCDYVHFGSLSSKEQLDTINKIIDDIYNLTETSFTLFKNSGDPIYLFDWELTEDGDMVSPQIPKNDRDTATLYRFHIVLVAIILAIKYRNEGKPKPSFNDIGDWSSNSDNLKKFMELGMKIRNGESSIYNHAYYIKMNEILSKENCALAKNALVDIHNSDTYEGKAYAPASFDRYQEFTMLPMFKDWNTRFCTDGEDSLNDFITSYTDKYGLPSGKNTKTKIE